MSCGHRTLREECEMLAREIMTTDVAVANHDDTIEDVARKMEERDTGALPICNSERRLEGMVTDRDIALRIVARGLDPKSTRVAEISQQAEVVTIGADDSLEEAARTMEQHAVRRLPVIDGTELVGMISQGDLAKHLDEARVGDVVETISESP
jgi:CBS domain-containing protein